MRSKVRGRALDNARRRTTRARPTKARGSIVWRNWQQGRPPPLSTPRHRSLHSRARVERCVATNGDASATKSLQCSSSHTSWRQTRSALQVEQRVSNRLGALARELHHPDRQPRVERDHAKIRRCRPERRPHARRVARAPFRSRHANRRARTTRRDRGQETCGHEKSATNRASHSTHSLE